MQSPCSPEVVAQCGRFAEGYLLQAGDVSYGQPQHGFLLLLGTSCGGGHVVLALRCKIPHFVYILIIRAGSVQDHGIVGKCSTCI